MLRLFEIILRLFEIVWSSGIVVFHTIHGRTEVWGCNIKKWVPVREKCMARCDSVLDFRCTLDTNHTTGFCVWIVVLIFRREEMESSSVVSRGGNTYIMAWSTACVKSWTLKIIRGTLVATIGTTRLALHNQ